MKIDEAPIRHDRRRGCGWRDAGGLYFVAGALWRTCGKLPALLKPCDSCGRGYSWSKGWTWINNTYSVFGGLICKLPADECVSDDLLTGACALALVETAEGWRIYPIGDRCGLLWIGRQYYETPADFRREAAEQGVSRKIKQIPRDFVLGETWIALAHVDGGACDECGGKGVDPTAPDGDRCIPCDGSGKLPAIFSLFKPTAIEYVCRGDEQPDELDSLLERNITPVRVVRVDDEGCPIPDPEQS